MITSVVNRNHIDGGQYKTVSFLPNEHFFSHASSPAVWLICSYHYMPGLYPFPLRLLQHPSFRSYSRGMYQPDKPRMDPARPVICRIKPERDLARPDFCPLLRRSSCCMASFWAHCQLGTDQRPVSCWIKPERDLTRPDPCTFLRRGSRYMAYFWARCQLCTARRAIPTCALRT